MLMLGKEIMNKKIVHIDNDEEKAKVDDILLHKDKADMAYLTFELDAPIVDPHMNGPAGDDQAFEVASASGSQSMPGNWAATTDAGSSVKTKKQTFFIPEAEIERITANAVLMKGTEVEQEHGERMEHASLSALLDRSVETEGGEKVGKIKDVVIEESEKKIIGFKLSEGLWEKIVGDGTKYMPYTGIIDWTEEGPLIVESWTLDQLVDDYEQLI